MKVSMTINMIHINGIQETAIKEWDRAMKKCDVVVADEDSQVEYLAEYQQRKISFYEDGADLILERVEDSSLMNIRS